MTHDIKVGDKVLATTDAWFQTPSGELCKGVFGTVHGIRTSEEMLGVKTNAKSTNWYVIIGNMTIAGCQLHYIIKTNSYNPNGGTMILQHELDIKTMKQPISRIYNADENYMYIPHKGFSDVPTPSKEAQLAYVEKIKEYHNNERGVHVGSICNYCDRPLV